MLLKTGNLFIIFSPKFTKNFPKKLAVKKPITIKKKLLLLNQFQVYQKVNNYLGYILTGTRSFTFLSIKLIKIIEI